MNKQVAIVAVVLCVVVPEARADWLFTPAFGTTFGADTHGREHSVYAAAVTQLSQEAVGWEIGVAYAPDFFEGHHAKFDFTGDSNVGTLMLNGMIGFGPRDEGIGAVFPYMIGGLGVMQMRVVSRASPDHDWFHSLVHEVGWNFGAGAFVFPNSPVGIRADVRYFQSFQNQVPSWTRGLAFDVAPGEFDFWRTTFGVTVRFAE